MKRVRLFAVLSAVVLALAFAGCNGTTDGPENSGNTENQGNQGNQGNEGNQGNQEDPPAPVIYQFHETVTVMPAGTDGSAGTSATYVLFGDWPQTVKAEGVEVDDDDDAETTITRGDFTYYLGSDNNYYVKCTENAKYTEYTYSDGTTASILSANNTKFFKVEPIKWKVLMNSSNGNRLLLAEKALTGLKYDPEEPLSNNYMNSYMREWLNGTFLNSAFTDNGKSKIPETTVDNSARSSNTDANAQQWHNGENQFECGNTTDKVFLLSMQEVTKSDYGFAIYTEEIGDSNGTQSSSRLRTAVDYAIANKVCLYNQEIKSCRWYLRSPVYDNSSQVYGVSEKGGATSLCSVSSPSSGVVPALCVAAN